MLSCKTRLFHVGIVDWKQPRHVEVWLLYPFKARRIGPQAVPGRPPVRYLHCVPFLLGGRVLPLSDYPALVVLAVFELYPVAYSVWLGCHAHSSIPRPTAPTTVEVASAGRVGRGVRLLALP